MQDGPVEPISHQVGLVPDGRVEPIAGGTHSPLSGIGAGGVRGETEKQSKTRPIRPTMRPLADGIIA